jgi:hypothetical protein
MKVECSEKADDSDTNICLGIASWDDGDKTEFSVKYAWKDKNGKVARGGEFPVEVLPQALEFAIRKEYLSRREVAKYLARISRFLEKKRPAK